MKIGICILGFWDIGILIYGLHIFIITVYLLVAAVKRDPALGNTDYDDVDDQH